MIIKKLRINNYKSIKEISISNPAPFSVFVGPNAAGKSNIFEALEFYTSLSEDRGFNFVRLFGDISNYNIERAGASSTHTFNVDFLDLTSNANLTLNDNGSLVMGSSGFIKIAEEHLNELKEQYLYLKNPAYNQFFGNFSRIFVGNEKIEKFKYEDDKKLSLSCRNLEPVLKRILSNELIKEIIKELLEVLIPGFSNIEVKTEELSGSSNLLVYEKHSPKPLSKKIISDGTYNIISILTALYQSDTPQFLCIEEPENGLNPKVARELVSVFRSACEDYGHSIWLNTHSQTIVSELRTNEIILVDKKEGETKIKQIQEMDLKGMRMDEALLTNAIGGGIPW